MFRQKNGTFGSKCVLRSISGPVDFTGRTGGYDVERGSLRPWCLCFLNQPQGIKTMHDMTMQSDQRTTQNRSERDSLVPGVPADFIIEAIRKIDRELAKLEVEISRAASRGDIR